MWDCDVAWEDIDRYRPIGVWFCEKVDNAPLRLCDIKRLCLHMESAAVPVEGSEFLLKSQIFSKSQLSHKSVSFTRDPIICQKGK